MLHVTTHLVLLGVGGVSRGRETFTVWGAAGVTGGHADGVHALPWAASRRRSRHLSDRRAGWVVVCSKKQPEKKRDTELSHSQKEIGHRLAGHEYKSVTRLSRGKVSSAQHDPFTVGLTLMYSQAESLHHAFSRFGWSRTAVAETLDLTGQRVAARKNRNNTTLWTVIESHARWFKEQGNLRKV